MPGVGRVSTRRRPPQQTRIFWGTAPTGVVNPGPLDAQEPFFFYTTLLVGHVCSGLGGPVGRTPAANARTPNSRRLFIPLLAGDVGDVDWPPAGRDR